MKKKKRDKRLPTIDDITRIVGKSQEELALVFGRGLRDVEDRLTIRIDALDSKIEDVKDDLGAQISVLGKKLTGTNTRIDDLAFSRIKYEDHQKLVERVDKIEGVKAKKR